MSLKSWKEEFLNDSVLKTWRGLRVCNLKKHELIMKTGYILEEKSPYNSLEIYSAALPFCKHSGKCNGDCPIFNYLKNPCFEVGQPFYAFAVQNKIGPMIEVIEKINKRKNKTPRKFLSTYEGD